MTLFEKESAAPALLNRLKTKPSVALTGAPGGSKAYLLAQIASEWPASLFIVTAEDVEAEGLLSDLECWGGFLSASERPDFLLYPEMDAATRLASLGALTQKKNKTVMVCSKAALSMPTLAPNDLTSASIDFIPGRSYPRAKLLERLAGGGYERTDMVEMQGEVAVRGEVLDVWAPDSERPWRLLFDGDELESMREFMPGTQRSEGYLTGKKLLPIKETKPSGTLKAYVPPQSLWFWDDTEPETFPALVYQGLGSPDAVDLGFLSTTGVGNGIARAAQEAARVHQQGGRVIFFSFNAGESERLRELLEDQLGSQGTEGMEFLSGSLRTGFSKPAIDGQPALLVLTNAEIFGRYRHRPRLPKFKGGGKIHEVSDIRSGDYVVHELHGVGRYKGLELIRAGGQEAEYLKLEYAKGDRLYVPLYDFKQVQKYSGSEGKSPRLSSLDTAAWERVKARVKESVQEVAKDLLKVHATRASLPGHAFPPDTHLEEEFAASFLYEETVDQKRAIEEVRRDMLSSRPMDRLILGDVGYGKTEVAMRAAFKAVVGEKQVAVLVPTTILAEQHFRTFKERFADYPARIGILSRFQSAKEEKETLLGMANGTIDVAIGTHRLFQKDIVFKDLGLLIIDEEHRFGVKHKEQMKQLRQHLDVLTLTATPIPRTLSFALSGLRELSTIETPPTGRLPVSTQVGAYEESVVKTAIVRELERGGQVFYVHNRVQSMQARLHFLQGLLPDTSFAVVHGQMSGPQIEKIMWEFVHRKHQVLLATSIIESGIDIPSVNTLIVEEAEEFGLAQLYQLRGRVGRDRQKAYCYLLYSPGVPLTQEARARLEALREFTQLGSGYRLAVRDMEIRGAGNLLGQQQHGHIAAVGLDLYSQLLQEEIAHLRGETAPQTRHFPSMDLTLHAFLPAEYLPSEELRIMFYKKLVSADAPEALTAVGSELADRFGPLPPEALTLMRISELRLQARDLGVSGVIQKPSTLDIQFLANTPVNPSTVLLLAKERSHVRFKAGPPFTLLIEKEAFESAGPLDYLKDLFSRLASR